MTRDIFVCGQKPKTEELLELFILLQLQLKNIE